MDGRMTAASEEVKFMLLEDALKEFLLECELRQYSQRTIKHERNSIQKMICFIGKTYGVTKLEKVKHIHLKGYVKYLTDLGRKETYVNGLIKSFRAFFKYCVNEDYIEDNPALKLAFQKEPETLIMTFTDKEVEAMVNYYKGRYFLDIRNKLIMVILFDTGMRCSELCNLKTTDIRSNVINIQEGKGKKQRFVPLTPAINKWMMKYQLARENYIKDKRGYAEEYLFLSQKGRPLTKATIERIVKACKKPCNIRNEIRCSPHTCRHYYAQKQLRNGCDMYTVSRLLGHKTVTITKRYLQSITDEDIVDLGIKTSPLMNMKVR